MFFLPPKSFGNHKICAFGNACPLGRCMGCCASYGFIFWLWAYERLRVIRFTLFFSEKEKLFSLFQFIAHCGNLWAHQKVYNITQLSCLELWLLWCCLDSSRFCKQPGLALQHKVQCGPYHILYLEAVNVVRSGSAALGPISRDEGLPSLLQARVTPTRTQALSTHWYLPFSKLFFPQWQVLVLISSFKGPFLLDSLLRVNLDLLSSFIF